MAFDPDAFTAVSTAPAPLDSTGFDPDSFLNTPFQSASEGFNPDAFLNPAKQAYIQKQQSLQNQSLLQKAGGIASGLVSPELWSGLGDTVKQAITTAPQLLEPNQTGTNARQDLLNAGLINAADMSQAAQVQAPKFWNMLTGQKQTPEQLGNEYDETQDYAKVRGNIQQLGANPAISQQLSQNGGVGSILSGISAKGNANVDPERQNALEPIADPTMYIPGVGAEETAIRGGLSLLGRGLMRDAIEQAPKAGLTATLAGKTLGATGTVLGKVAGLKDGINSGLQAVAKSLGANEKLSELAGDHGTEMALGAASHMMGLGHSGLAVGAFGPTALAKTSNALTSAGKVLQEGEGTVPFFERMAQEAASQGNNLASKAYQLMDTSGAGDLLASAAKTIKNSVKATTITAPLQFPFAGNDPQQMAATIGGDLAMGAVGGAIHEMKPMSAPDFQARQDMDNFAMRNKFGSTWDDALQARTQTYLDRLAQDHPNIDPNTPAAQTFAAQAARSDMGTVATILRSNPGITPTFRMGEGNSHVISPDGKGSTINIDPSTTDMVSRTIGHELVHHIQAGGQRGEVMNQLLGDPESKTPGILRSYAENGTPIDTPEFQNFKTNYDKSLGAGGLEKSTGDKQSIADQIHAEEFYAEAVGSILGGHTNAGELNYARIRRAGINPGILEKFFGKKGSQLNPVKMGFMDHLDGTPSTFNPLEWLNKNPNLKKITFGYLTNKDYLGQMADKSHQYDNSFGNEERSIDWMKANPSEAFSKYGNDASLRFSPPDAKGNRNFEGVLSPKREKILAENQAKELFDKLKGNPKYTREITTADGKKSTQILHLDDKILGTLTHFNPYQKDILIKLNQAVNMAPGNVMRTTYQPALANGKRYKARERTIRHTVPYDIFISQPEGGKGGANILTHVLDIDQMLKNRTQILAAMNKAGLPIDPKYSDQQWFRESLGKMAQAHFAGKKSTDGTGLSDSDRDFLNATMGVTPQANKEHVEGINNLLDELKEKAGAIKVTSAVKSFRLDRINKMEHAPEWGQIPYQYFDSKRNRRPEEIKDATRKEIGSDGQTRANPLAFDSVERLQIPALSGTVGISKENVGAEEKHSGLPEGGDIKSNPALSADSRPEIKGTSTGGSEIPTQGISEHFYAKDPIITPSEQSRQKSSEAYDAVNGKEAGIGTGDLGSSSGEGNPPSQQDDRFTGTKPSSPKQWLDAYVSHIGEQAAKGKYEGDNKALFTHAGTFSGLVTPKKIDDLKPYAIKGGMEHDVYTPPKQDGEDRKVYKVTKPDGYSHDGGDEIDYLKHLDKLNAISGGKLNIQILGVNPREKGKWPSIVSKMNFVEGKKPSNKTLNGKMADYGFRPGDEYEWTHNDTGLTIRDGHTGNFIETPEGELIPIDVHLDGDVNKPMFPPSKENSLKKITK